jgi:predicted amidohydrolase YtcJ
MNRDEPAANDPAANDPAATGLTEHHAHLLMLGRSLTMADLSACADRDAMLERIADHARTLAPDAWVLAHGARPEAWPDPAWPTIAQLDSAGGGRPVCAWCFDQHALAASSAALASAGIDADTRIDHGRVVLGDDGRPTGLLLEHAAIALWNAVPEPAPAVRPGLIRAACGHLAALGYAEVHDMKAQPWLGRVLADLDEAGELPVRVRLYALLEDLDHLFATRRAWESERVALAGGKIFVDGTLNSRTARVIHPYADAPDGLAHGLAMMTPDEIETAVRRVDALNLPLAAHAIGDAAVRDTLDAVERARPKARGFRVEHAELIDAADVPRFAELGVAASLQPCHLLADIEALRRAVPDRLGRVLPVRDLLDTGLIPGTGVVFGSDVPIVRADPRDSIQAAVHRRRANTPPPQAVSPEQSIDEPTAWACFGRI